MAKSIKQRLNAIKLQLKLKLVKPIVTAILNYKLKVAKKKAHKYFNRINGAEYVYIMLVRKRFVILTRKHTKKLIRKGYFKRGTCWLDIKRNAIYTIEKTA